MTHLMCNMVLRDASASKKTLNTSAARPKKFNSASLSALAPPSFVFGADYMFILCNLCLNHAVAFALRSCERFLVIWPNRCRLVKAGYRIMETYLGEGKGPVFTDFTGSGKSIFVRKLSCVVVGTFKACNFVRLSSRPACPWGCTPTNRLYCRDMT